MRIDGSLTFERPLETNDGRWTMDDERWTMDIRRWVINEQRGTSNRTWLPGAQREKEYRVIVSQSVSVGPNPFEDGPIVIVGYTQFPASVFPCVARALVSSPLRALSSLHSGGSVR